MSETQRLSEQFAAEYLDKIFYFCLRKCGNPHDAEDLASEISLCVLSELDRGTVPDAFSGWVWRIARNRYARFVKRRRSDRDRLIPLPEDSSGGEILPDGDPDFAEELAKSEQNERLLRGLRESLAFIRQDYRQILVAYYVEDRPIKEIAARLGIPEGTVKNRLFRSKNQLKEGITMAREFGKRSYAPENIGLVMNGRDGKDGEPFSLIRRLISKNLLLAAYEKPLTAEELAIELGVALPYTEDALSELVEGTLMKKVGSRYYADFYIFSGETGRRMAALLADIAPDVTRRIIDLMEYKLSCAQNIRWHEGYQSLDDMKWTLLMETVNEVEKVDFPDPLPEPKDADHSAYWNRPNGGEWMISGEEAFEDDIPDFVGMHGVLWPEGAGDHPDFWQYKFVYRDIRFQTPEHLKPEEVYALLDVINKDFAKVPPKKLDELLDWGYLRKDGEGYLPTFLVQYRKNLVPLPAEQAAEIARRIAEIREILLEYREKCNAVIRADVPDHLKAHPYLVNYAASNNFVTLRGAVLEEALRVGYLQYADQPDEGKRRALGAVMRI